MVYIILKISLYIAFCCGVTRDFWQDNLLNSLNPAVQAGISGNTAAIFRPLHIQTLPFLPKASSSASSKEKINHINVQSGWTFPTSTTARFS
jgi:hypothetical protein